MIGYVILSNRRNEKRPLKRRAQRALIVMDSTIQHRAFEFPVVVRQHLHILWLTIKIIVYVAIPGLKKKPSGLQPEGRKSFWITVQKKFSTRRFHGVYDNIYL